jgi:hypothetical protein
MPRGRSDETDLATALSPEGDSLDPLDLIARSGGTDDEEEEVYLPEAPPYGEDDDEEDPDIADLNNPDVDTFGEPPLLGTRAPASDLFGGRADTVGRATSPKLYAQAANFPTAVQFRVWRWENGIPVALGAIDAEASEDDFVKKFYGAMPEEGDGRFQFKFRPVDMNGRELGKEFTKNISEHHDMVSRIRRQKDREREERGVQNDPILINQGGGDNGAYAEEMGRMFEQAVESAERRTEVLQTTLEDERDRLRNEEKARFAERIAVADRSAEVVQKMTERLMESDQARAKEQLQAQENQSGMLVQTLTTVFSQQQQAAQAQAERLRQGDEVRMRQDREFFERQRVEVEMKRKSDQAEFEMRRGREREESERARLKEKDEAESRLLIERDRLKLEQTRIEEARKFELEQARMESERRETEADRRREVEREELRRREEMTKTEGRRREETMQSEAQRREADLDRRRDAERIAADARAEAIRAEAQRREADLDRRRESEKAETAVRLEREKLEMDRKEARAREERERWRVEIEEKRRSEREDWDRKMTQQKEDAERRERIDRERVERERQDFQLRMERERQEREDAAVRRTEQARADEDRRKDESRRAEEARKAEMELKLRQIEIESKRSQDHQERMAEQARLDREARSQAQERRDRIEREAREAADRDRTRQHDMQMRQMELERESAREHQERLAMAQGGGESSGGGGLFGTIGAELGLEPTEILAKIFGSDKDGEEGGWSDAIPKVLGSIAELGKAALSARDAQQQQITAKGRRRIVAQPAQGQVIQTPQGPMVYAPGGPGAGLVMTEPGLVPAGGGGAAPTQAGGRPFLPPQFDEYEEEDESDSSPAADEAASETVPAVPAEPVNTLARAKEAGISLMDQKKARKAIRALGDKLGDADADDWLGLITQAITEEVGIYYYIKAVTVDAALAEATNDPVLHGAVIAAMRDSGLIPGDVPYTEADYAALKAGSEETA